MTTQLRRPATEADLDLLARLHHGDRAGFAELYHHTAPPWPATSPPGCATATPFSRCDYHR